MFGMMLLVIYGFILKLQKNLKLQQKILISQGQIQLKKQNQGLAEEKKYIKFMLHLSVNLTCLE